MAIDSNIRNHIKKYGYIKIDDMMRESMSANSKSYYKSKKDIGKNGDFITSPEISQLFSEIVVLWVIEKWLFLGSPKKFALVELGPGNGTLINDFLKTAKINSQFYNAIELFLYEINPFFIESQQNYIIKHKVKANWLKEIAELPPIPTIIINNEFFDALPIKQYYKNNKWFERILVTDPISAKIKFNKIELDKNLNDQLILDHLNTKDGAVIEESIDSLVIIRKLSHHIYKNHGAVLIIDYGYNIPPYQRTKDQYNPTLQAIRHHKYCPILNNFGETDLSSHVDFYALSKAAKEQSIKNINYSTQQDFLLKYGINIRLSNLKKSLPPGDFNNIKQQVLRLTSPEQMGELFKVLELLKI